MQNIPPEVQSAFQQKESYLLSFIPDLTANQAGIYQNADGNWQCHYSGCNNATWAQISSFPDGRCFETHGGICQKWYEVNSWIGLPLSDEESDGPEHRISHFEHGDIRWSLLSNTSEIIPKDRRSWYAYRHGELLGCLKEAVEISQPQRHEEALKAVQKKCREDQFDVVLLGEFQDGKSTTFDVLCRGRELSPQGKGIEPTSAVPVSVLAILPGDCKPDGMDEWAELQFKDELEIKGEIFDTFQTYIQDADSNIANGLKEFARPIEKENPRQAFQAKFNLNSADHLEIVRRIVEREWEDYAKDAGNIKTFHRQMLQVLSIYLRYLGTAEYRALVDTHYAPLCDAASYVCFPSDWSAGRAPKSLLFDLSFEECRFAFLSRAVLHIHSDILARLNCKITDCPGLGSSAYDTAVACQALEVADGVWFVKRGDKGVGQSVQSAILDLVKETGRDDRTGMAVNLWIPHDEALDSDEDSLFNYCKKQFREMRCNFPVFWCNARLAYLAALGRRKLEDGAAFVESERERMQKIVGRKKCDPAWSDQELWVKAVLAANRSSRVEELDDIYALEKGSVDLLWKHSNMEEALEVMANIVVRQKGRSILIDNGSKKALDTLMTYECDLADRENVAISDAQANAKRLQTAKDEMDKFERLVQEDKDGSRLFNAHSGNLVKDLSADFIEHVFGGDFADRFADKCAVEAYKLNHGYYFKMGLSDFAEKVKANLYPKLIDLVQTRFVSFKTEIWKRESAAPHVREFFDLVDRFNKQLESRTADLREKGGAPVKGLPTPVVENPEMSSQGASAIQDRMDDVVDSMRDGFWARVWELLLIVISLGIKNLFFGKTKEECIRDVKERTKPKIEESLLKSRRVLESVAMPMFRQILNTVGDDADKSVKQFRSLFQARCDESEAASRESDENKRRIAEECSTIRETKVAPLRKRLEAFEKVVLSEL